VSAALAGRTLTVKALDAGGDFIHAGDVAEALTALLRAPKLNHPVYNVAYGEFVLIRELIDIVREVAPDLQVQVKSDSEADITYDPRNRLGRWSDYAIDRLWHNVGWKPRPIREALHHYWHWAKHHAT
jgi:UDP-glucose 4-epimerase